MSLIRKIAEKFYGYTEEIYRCLNYIRDEPDQDTREKEKLNVATKNRDETIVPNHRDVTDVVEHVTEQQNLFQHGLWWKQLASGCLGGVVSRTITAPLDRVKIMLQASAVEGGKKFGLVSGFRMMMTEGGFQSLWRGNFINCMKIGPELAIKMFAFEQLKSTLRQDNQQQQLLMWQKFMSGATGGMIAQTSIYPMEVLKTRLALANTGEYRNIFDCGRKLYAIAGVRGFYRGILPSIIGIIPHSGVDLCVYQTLKENYTTSYRDKRKPTLAVILFSGSLSSACAMAIGYPLALVRTNMQAQVNTLSSCKSMIQIFRSIWSDHGVRGFYRGIVPNFMKAVPACSISYVVYEKVRAELGLA